MKKLYFIAFALAVCLQCFAQTALDLTSQAMLRRAKMAERVLPQQHKAKQIQANATASPMLALVKLQDGASVQDLVADGFDVKELRCGFAVVGCSVEEATRLAAHKSIKKCEFNRQRTFSLREARAASGIDNVHNGLGLPQPITGKGVITGIVDSGFDPNHINFKDEEGNSRFDYFAIVEPNSTGTGVRTTPYTKESLASLGTDDNTQTHGTHTLGIMAGSFKGEATVGVYDEQTKKGSVQTINNPHYGVAPGSSLYASAGAGYDALIAYGVDGMLEHRWYNAHNTPVVINLSLGGNQGPHDGSGVLAQYLDAVALQDGAIVCISSGNEGDLPITYHKTFTEEDNSFATFIRPYQYSDVRYGMVEMYSNNADEFDVSVIIYNKARKKVARTFPLNLKDGIQYICSDASYKQSDTDIIDATFAKAYKGYVGIGSKIDEESGRFYAAIDYYVINSDENPAEDITTEAQYTLGFLVKGKNGQRVDCYCDGIYTVLDSYGYDGYVDGMFNGTVTDIATGKNTITVGAYNTKEYESSIYAYPLGYDDSFPKNAVTSFSSFGTLIDGRNLPHLLAPGNLVVSSMSTPYMRNSLNGVTDQIATVKYNDGKRDNYFYPMMGTSMAAPMVAGTVALMLEVNPDLTVETAREILMETAVKDQYTALVQDPVQVGAGKLNSYEAVKKALMLSSSIKNVSTRKTNRMLFSSTGYRTFSIYLADANHIDATLYNLAGTEVLTTTSRGEEATIDATALTPGVYMLKVNGGEAQRILIK